METFKPVRIKQVWAHNLEEEFALIRQALPEFRFAAVDTEFPGHVFEAQVDGHRIGHLPPTETYRIMKSNVDVLKIIQLGLSLCDSRGRLPHFGTEFSYVWEFNFNDFCLDYDPYNEGSIELLKSQGIDFSKNREMGISSLDFVRQMFLSGLIHPGSPIIWITFHGSYDFAFMIKMLSQRSSLPASLLDFMSMVKEYLGPRFYDVKYMIKSCDGLYGGLDQVARSLQVDRAAGKSHQAGSDSLLTLATFLTLASQKLDRAALCRSCSVLFGLEPPAPPRRCFPTLMFVPVCPRSNAYCPQPYLC